MRAPARGGVQRFGRNAHLGELYRQLVGLEGGSEAILKTVRDHGPAGQHERNGLRQFGQFLRRRDVFFEAFYQHFNDFVVVNRERVIQAVSVHAVQTEGLFLLHASARSRVARHESRLRVDEVARLRDAEADRPAPTEPPDRYCTVRCRRRCRCR